MSRRPRSEYLAHRLNDGHWLRFNDEGIVGCHCGFVADPDDGGFGDSVLDHFEDVVRAEIAAALEAVDRVEWALAGQHAGADAARIARGEA